MAVFPASLAVNSSLPSPFTLKSYESPRLDSFKASANACAVFFSPSTLSAVLVSPVIVTLTVDEKNVCHIKSGKSEFTINGQPAEQFPEVPVVNKRENIVLKSADIKNMIKQTIFSVATDESKPILTGELFKFDENCFNAVAIDGFRVSWRKTVCEYDGYTEMVVPSKTLNELARLLSDDENEKATIYYSSSYILFEIKGCTIVSRLLDGEFLNYENLFVENSLVKLTANTHELLSAFERATIVSEDNKKTPVILTIKENNLNIKTTTDRGLVNEDVPITLDGEELVITFNARYIIDILKVVEEEYVTMNFNTNKSPCIVTGVTNHDYKYLVLPINPR